MAPTSGNARSSLTKALAGRTESVKQGKGAAAREGVQTRGHRKSQHSQGNAAVAAVAAAAPPPASSSPPTTVDETRIGVVTRAGARAAANRTAAPTSVANTTTASQNTISSRKKSGGGLPTPPNSLSPSLPPQQGYPRTDRPPVTDQHGRKLSLQQHFPPHSSHPSARSHDQADVELPSPPPAALAVDSDIDLDEAIEHAAHQNSPHRSLSRRLQQRQDSPDAAGDITPTMLAKHHLPRILIDNGPLAIRHIMGFLTTTVPGFSGIPPAKARRVVVSALEARGDDGQPGGLNDEIIFEKVGWGRWSARNRKAGTTIRPHHLHSASSKPWPMDSAPRGLQIPKSHQRSERTMAMPFGSHLSHHSYGVSPSASFQQEEDEDDNSEKDDEEEAAAIHHLPDPMSLDGAHDDGDEFCASPMIRAQQMGHRQSTQKSARRKFHSAKNAAAAAAAGDDDATDEEDWAHIGAKALRKGSLNSTGGMALSSSLPRRHQHHPQHASQHSLHHHQPYADAKSRHTAAAAVAAAGSVKKKLSSSHFAKHTVPTRPATSSLSTSHSSSVLYTKLQQEQQQQQQQAQREDGVGRHSSRRHEGEGSHLRHEQSFTPSNINDATRDEDMKMDNDDDDDMNARETTWAKGQGQGEAEGTRRDEEAIAALLQLRSV